MIEQVTQNHVAQKATPTTLAAIDACTLAAEQERRRQFGLSCFAAFKQIAYAFYRYYVGGTPKCDCRKKLS